MPNPEKLSSSSNDINAASPATKKASLFQNFGLNGSLDVWKPVVLIEMKKRGENLQKHYRQHKSVFDTSRGDNLKTR